MSLPGKRQNEGAFAPQQVVNGRAVSQGLHVGIAFEDKILMKQLKRV
ncbi:MAG: hypothetical protein NZV14_10545 [Bryobacteraceae bacterium]|nr:hypothetical protein [Bryobacteraceae bacterium]MDW8378592.1 hypothetical protein [Bryobacterales bacterium]